MAKHKKKSEGQIVEKYRIGPRTFRIRERKDSVSGETVYDAEVWYTTGVNGTVYLDEFETQGGARLALLSELERLSKIGALEIR